MSVIVTCYVSVICLVVGGVVRVRLHIIYAHLCNHHTRFKVVVRPGAQLCTLVEVWILGVGMSTLGSETVCTPRIMFRSIRVDHTNCLQVAINSLIYPPPRTPHLYTFAAFTVFSEPFLLGRVREPRPVGSRCTTWFETLAGAIGSRNTSEDR